ncbi:MAG: BTAD domain-containing putative transcriptional regulator [Chloroflexota bacterium]
MAKILIQLFGAPQITWQSEPIVGLTSNKARALLIYLAVTASKGNPAHSRDALADLLWADKPATSRDNLKKALSHLRKLNGISFVEEGWRLVALDLSDAWVDVAEFEQLSSELESRTIEGLQRAAQLYRAGFLADFNTSLSYEFEEWVLSEQTRLKNLMVAILRRLAAAHSQRNEYAQAIVVVRRLLALEPWQEETHRQLMELLARKGDRVAALAHFEECRKILADELNVEPAPSTIEIAEKIRDGSLGKAKGKTSQPDLISDANYTNLIQKHNLPAQTMPLVGREDELAEITRLLNDPRVQLLSILGPGGMGKTRLAIEVASAVLDKYAHGVYFIPLAPLSDPASIVSTIAANVGYPFENDRGSPKAQLLDFLQQREMLLILDNAEHLLVGVNLLTEIIESAPTVVLLVTTRERLRLMSESVFVLDGLALPDHENEVTSSAEQLFIQTAQRVRYNFVPTPEDRSTLAQICQLVGGMPLALILAASWVEMLSLSEIAAEINESVDFLAIDYHDLPERQRSLQAVFDTTWRRLSVAEQDIFKKLAVFRGGFTREAASAVASATLQLLTTLSHKALIRFNSEGRYEIHELLRQFGEEKLASEAEAAYDAHSAYYCTFLQQRETDLKGARQKEAIAEIEADSENVQMAWTWACQAAQVDRLAQSIESLGIFILWQSRLYDGEALFEQTISALGLTRGNGYLPDGSKSESPDADKTRLTIRIFIWLSIFRRHLRKFEAAKKVLQHAQSWLADFALLGHDTRLEQALLLLEEAEVNFDYRDRAMPLFEKSLSLLRTLDARRYMAQALDRLGHLLRILGSFEQARAVIAEGLALRQELGDLRGVAASFETQCMLSRWMGSFDEAENAIRRAIALYSDLGDVRQAAHGFNHLASTMVFSGKFMESLQVFEECRKRYDTLDLPGVPNFPAASFGFALMHLGRYEEAQTQLEHSLSSYDVNIGSNAYAVNDLGRIALAKGFYNDAHHYLEESVDIFHDKGGDMNGLGQAYGCLGYLALRLGNLDQARTYIRENLTIAIDTQPFLPSLTALSGMALLHLEAGKTEVAVELYTVCLQHRHVANSRWYEEVVGQYIAEAAKTLPPAATGAAQQRGRDRELHSTLQEFLKDM